THPEDTDVIRLMTIHQSKGLEFPVVVVPDLGRRPPNASNRVAFDPQLGPLVSPPGSDAVVGLTFFNKLEAIEEEAERHRLLYVATTRAADYLILSSSMDEPGQTKAPWLKLLSQRFDLLEGKPASDVQCAETPRITVTLKRPEPPGPPPGAAATGGTECGGGGSGGQRKVPAAGVGAAGEGRCGGAARVLVLAPQQRVRGASPARRNLSNRRRPG